MVEYIFGTVFTLYSAGFNHTKLISFSLRVDGFRLLFSVRHRFVEVLWYWHSSVKPRYFSFEARIITFNRFKPHKIPIPFLKQKPQKDIRLTSVHQNPKRLAEQNRLAVQQQQRNQPAGQEKKGVGCHLIIPECAPETWKGRNLWE